MVSPTSASPSPLLSSNEPVFTRAIDGGGTLILVKVQLIVSPSARVKLTVSSPASYPSVGFTLAPVKVMVLLVAPVQEMLVRPKPDSGVSVTMYASVASKLGARSANVMVLFSGSPSKPLSSRVKPWSSELGPPVRV